MSEIFSSAYGMKKDAAAVERQKAQDQLDMLRTIVSIASDDRDFAAKRADEETEQKRFEAGMKHDVDMKKTDIAADEARLRLAAELEARQRAADKKEAKPDLIKVGSRWMDASKLQVDPNTGGLLDPQGNPLSEEEKTESLATVKTGRMQALKAIDDRAKLEAGGTMREVVYADGSKGVEIDLTGKKRIEDYKKIKERILADPNDLEVKRFKQYDDIEQSLLMAATNTSVRLNPNAVVSNEPESKPSDLNITEDEVKDLGYTPGQIITAAAKKIDPKTGKPMTPRALLNLIREKKQGTK